MSELYPLADESVVATLPPDEDELSRIVSNVELEARSIVIRDDNDFVGAGEFGRMLKQKESEVVSFFAPMKSAAHKAHAEICSREKAMLTPLSNATATLKRTMGAYTLHKENERKAIEDEARRKVQAEAERKLVEAAAYEVSGNPQAAADAMLDAQISESMGMALRVYSAAPKTEGVSVGTDWEVTSIGPGVPIEFNGIELRPVDVKAVIRLIRASQGKVSIPGVQYKEVSKISIRK